MEYYYLAYRFFNFVCYILAWYVIFSFAASPFGNRLGQYVSLLRVVDVGGWVLVYSAPGCKREALLTRRDVIQASAERNIVLYQMNHCDAMWDAHLSSGQRGSG